VQVRRLRVDAVAGADAYSTNTNAPLSVPAPGVLGNDSDADGDAITAVAGALPAHGSLALNANGSFTYTPLGGYVGPDSFTYQALDPHGARSNVATATLTVRLRYWKRLLARSSPVFALT